MTPRGALPFDRPAPLPPASAPLPTGLLMGLRMRLRTGLRLGLQLRLQLGLRIGLLAGLLAVLAGCATPPAERDGAPESPPPGLAQRPDAEPRIEPLRVGGPNKPYEVAGRRYEPLTADLPLNQSGGASWYGRKFHGRPTASGEPYDMYAMTAAHKTMPIPSYARVRNPANGREVVVRINDRGPFADGRVIDLSYTAALKLGVLGGVAPVEVRRITHAQIRAGWASSAAPAAPAEAHGPVPMDVQTSGAELPLHP